jgi:ABC-2 type transport system permease protein
MRKYWAFYRLRFQRTLFYRGSVLLFRLQNILLLITLSAVWLASQSNGTIGGYTKNGLITYYLIGSLVNSIVFWNVGFAVKTEIRDGELGPKTLVKPISYYWQKFFEEFSWHTVSPLFAVVTTGIVALFLRANLDLNISLPTLVPMILSVGLGSALFFNISYCFGLLTFWLTETEGVMTFIWAGVFLFGGQAIPISFFSGSLRALINLMPFRYVYSFPLEIYSRQLLSGDLVGGLALQVFWVLLFGILGSFLWRRGLVRYSAYGG